MNMRPNKLARSMMRAELESMWSTCLRGKAGAIVVDNDGAIIATGYNGSPVGMEHCLNVNDTPDESCTYCVHAETNAIVHAARQGSCLAQATMFSLVRPCLVCAKNIIQAGMGALYYRYDYKTDKSEDKVLHMLSSKLAHIEKLKMSVEEVVFSGMLNRWREYWMSGSLKSVLDSDSQGCA